MKFGLRVKARKHKTPRNLIWVDGPVKNPREGFVYCIRPEGNPHRKLTKEDYRANRKQKLRYLWDRILMFLRLKKKQNWLQPHDPLDFTGMADMIRAIVGAPSEREQLLEKKMFEKSRKRILNRLSKNLPQ